MTDEEHTTMNHEGQTVEPVEEPAGATTTESPVDTSSPPETAPAPEASVRDQHGAAITPATGEQAAEATSDDRLIALLSYASQLVIPFVLPLIILVSESNKKRPFQRYHALQSLGLALAITLTGAAITIGLTVIQLIPVVGQLILLAALCLSPLAGLAVIGLALYYGYQAYQGTYVKIPALTTFMQDQGWL